MIWSIVIILFLAGLAFYFLSRILIIPQNHVVVIERFGRYTKTLKSGIHLMRPFETIKPLRLKAYGKTTVYNVIPLFERRVDQVGFRIFEPAKACYLQDFAFQDFLDACKTMSEVKEINEEFQDTIGIKCLGIRTPKINNVSPPKELTAIPSYFHELQDFGFTLDHICKIEVARIKADKSKINF